MQNIDINKIIKSVAEIQTQLMPYEKNVSEDGPYIQIWPNKVTLVDCYGTIISSGQAIEEILINADSLV